MAISDTANSHYGQQVFPNTRWSVVLAARRTTSSASAKALEDICRAYWYPLYAFARRSGQSPCDAQDLTQEFFRHLLEKRWLDSADQEKGKLRTFLIVALKRFMAKDWRRLCTQRRGGGYTHVPVDTDFAESRYASNPSAILAPEDVFDRQWALTLIDLTLEKLQAEFAKAGKASDFEVLKPSLMAARGTIDYASIGAQLKNSEATARVAVHRLRKRFREIYRNEVRQTLSEGIDLEAEMNHLAEILSRY